MKTNLGICSFLSVKSLEAQARKAVARTRSGKEVASAARKKSVKLPRIPQIDRDINSICRALKSRVSENETVILERPKGGYAYRASLSVYTRVDGGSLIPKEKYNFYPSTLDPDRLGSVAIYGGDPRALQERIRRSGTLFGHPVRRVAIETGLRRYVDVTLLVVAAAVVVDE